jgi:hypothetical protein
MGRAAALGDSTRFASFANGNFLPSAIPVAGQPYFGSGYRMNLQGNGSAVGVSAVGAIEPGISIGGHSQLLVRDASLPAVDGGNSNIAIQQAYGQINRLSVGLMETAFADPSAVPETLDLAGPNARTTINPAGLGEGQGRISYNFFADGSEGGFTTTISAEQPQPHIQTSDTSGVFSIYPDLIGVVQYVDGDMINNSFHEKWHLQFASIGRSLGLEDETGAFRQQVFGWGMSFSGACRFTVSPMLETKDRIVFSTTYGQGISHYITDLNAAPDTNDAVINGANALVALPVFSWYVGYRHNWTDYVRSTATFSQVNLDSIAPLSATQSPYRTGNYAGVNLVYHTAFQIADQSSHNFFTGLEYLYGHRETLDGATGDAHRVMWVTAISN